MTNSTDAKFLARLFSAWGRLVGERPIAIVIGCLTVTGLLLSQIPQLTFDTSFESFLSEDHETRVTLDAFREQFGRGEPVVVAVAVPDRIADPVFLKKLDALHQDLEARVGELDRITSLVNVRATRAAGEELEIGELLADWPSSQVELDALETFIRTTPLYENYLIGEPRTPEGQEQSIGWTAILLEAELYATEEFSGADAGEMLHSAGFDSPAETEGVLPPVSAPRRLSSMDDAALLASVRAVLAEHRELGLESHLAGSLVVGEVVSRTLKSDFARLLGLAACAIMVLLYFVFRRVSASVLVLGVVLLSLAGCLGLMAALDAPVGFGTQILPAFLLAAGVGYAVHVVTLFQHYLAEESNPLPVDGLSRDAGRVLRRRAVVRTLGHSGPPILLTALTTMGGLLSFLPAELAPIVQLGVFAPVGIGLAALYSVVLLPALLVLIPIRFRNVASAERSSTRRVTEIGLWAASHPRAVLIPTAALVALSIFGLTRLETHHDPLEWLPSDSPINAATAVANSALGGASVLELRIESAEPGGFQTPDLLTRLDRFEKAVLELESEEVVIGKVVGLHNVIKELNQSLNADRPSEYRIPEDPRLVAQELILFENSGMDDVEQLVDSTYSVAKVSIRVNHLDAFYSSPFANRVETLAHHYFDDRATVVATGMFNLKNTVFVNVIESLKASYVLGFFVIAGLLVLMVGDLRIGLVSLIPNTVPVLFAMGMMGLVGIPLGVYTMLVGSIAMGLAVDDTIHMAHSFVRYERQGQGAKSALTQTLSTAGVAVLFTSAALVCGFLIFGLATLSALLHFGIVAATAIAAALAADLLVSPVLFKWVADHRAPAPRTRSTSRTKRDREPMAEHEHEQSLPALG